MFLLTLPLSLFIVLGGMWLITSQLVKVIGAMTETVMRAAAEAVAGATEQAVKGAVEAVAAVMGPVVPEQEIAAQETAEGPVWEQWGVEDEGTMPDPLDRLVPDPVSWRADAVGVAPGFQFDPREPDLAGEQY